MSRELADRLSLILLAIALSIVSIQSMQHVSQLNIKDPELSSYLKLGEALEDLCQTFDQYHEHAECPFCHEPDLFELAPLSGLVLSVSLMKWIQPTFFGAVAPSQYDGWQQPVRAPPIE